MLKRGVSLRRREKRLATDLRVSRRSVVHRVGRWWRRRWVHRAAVGGTWLVPEVVIHGWRVCCWEKTVFEIGDEEEGRRKKSRRGMRCCLDIRIRVFLPLLWLGSSNSSYTNTIYFFFLFYNINFNFIYDFLFLLVKVNIQISWYIFIIKHDKKLFYV